MKNRYLDIMEAAFLAYGEDHVRDFFGRVKREGLTEHGFPRLTANLVILLAKGRQNHLKELAEEMFLFCCEAMPGTRNAGNDFSVKELVFALLEAEKAELFPKSLTEVCRRGLGAVEPLQNYDCIANAPDEEVGNWAAYNAASEVMRQAAGLCNADTFLERQLPTQMRMFDKNGMYRDPHEPMLYDMATRVQLAILLHEGYHGRYRDAIVSELRRSEELTLKMQSVTGLLPFGGRSNQFLFNEAYLAAMCEFYAARAQSEGEKEKAGQFKDAAELACASIEEALKADPVRHIRNRYEQLSDAGCEGYAYFDKYMISLASFIYVAYRFADDSVETRPCPARKGGYIIHTSEYFHKLFCHMGEYFLEFDLKADRHYDASGLGRVHKKGVPMPICLSVPFPGEESYYTLPVKNKRPLSLCASFLPEEGAVGEYLAEKAGICGKIAEVILRPANGGWREYYRVTKEGVEIEVVADEGREIYFHLPVFDFDGKEHTAVQVTADAVTVAYRGFTCRYEVTGEIIETGEYISNRNGVYRHLLIKGKRPGIRISL